MLLLLSWWYGQSGFEKRFDPVEAAEEERNAAIKERDHAQRAWEGMVVKYEQVMATNLELRAELDKASKDVPWLEQKHFELAEANNIQHNEIEQLKVFKQNYNELLQQGSEYEISAKRPKYQERLASKIKDLQEEKKTAAEDATRKISNLDRDLSNCRKELVDAREVHAECEGKLGNQKTKIEEVETARRELEETIKQKDAYIEELEEANQELAEQPAQEPAENIRRLATANNDLDVLRREHAECKGRSESQTARISVLEAAERANGATIKVKDDRLAELQEQLDNSTSNDDVERQNQSHEAAITKKNDDYRALYDHYQQVVDKQKLAKTKHDEDVRSLQTMQQSVARQQLELQRLWTERNHLRVLHSNCNGRIADLTAQLRQGGNTYTDLQTKYTTQAKELDEVNKDISGLRSQIASLQEANAALEQLKSSSESNFEKYRVEGEARARPMWQANFDREMSIQAKRLEASEGEVFKLKNQLQQSKSQANPLREMQIQEREDAVKAKEDALKLGSNGMDHDQHGSKAEQEIKTLEKKLAAANKDAQNAQLRNRGIQSELKKERQERASEKARQEKALKKEQDDFANRTEILKLRLERENPLKDTVSKLQNEVARLTKDLEERKST